MRREIKEGVYEGGMQGGPNSIDNFSLEVGNFNFIKFAKKGAHGHGEDLARSVLFNFKEGI